MSIAVDVQGPEVVRPYTQKFQVSFPVAVDTSDVFGQAFGLKAIPVSFLVDEVGLVRLRGGAPTKEFLKEVETILQEPVVDVRGVSPVLPVALSEGELLARVQANPKDWEARLALAQWYDGKGRFVDAFEQLDEAFPVSNRKSAVLFTWGMVLLHQGEKPAALRKLKQARDLDPENWRIRKQIWAIENPDKFYTDQSPDYEWQKETLAKEKELANPGK